MRPDPNMEAVAASTALLRASVSAASDTGLGNLHELIPWSPTAMTALLVGITPEYFLFAALALAPGALIRRRSRALRLAGLSLEPEFL